MNSKLRLTSRVFSRSGHRTGLYDIEATSLYGPFNVLRKIVMFFQPFPNFGNFNDFFTRELLHAPFFLGKRNDFVIFLSLYDHHFFLCMCFFNDDFVCLLIDFVMVRSHRSLDNHLPEPENRFYGNPHFVVGYRINGKHDAGFF